MTHTDTPAEELTTGRRPSRWKVAVSALLVIWLVPQFVAGWKFANSQTYPIVGAAMFNGPPTPGTHDFLVPRVFATTDAGAQVELDQTTFGLEPFEWRRWIKRNLEDVSEHQADAAGGELAALYSERTGVQLSRLELWRIPALTDDFESGRLGRVIQL